MLPTLRLLLQLRHSSQCGPDFSLPVAFTIEEAIISTLVKAYVSTPHDSWFRDENCPSDGVEALLSTLGLAEEQFNLSLVDDMSADDEHRQEKSTESSASLLVFTYIAYRLQVAIHKRGNGRPVSA